MLVHAYTNDIAAFCAAKLLRVFLTFQLSTVNCNQVVSVKTGAQSTVTHGDLNANGRIDAMRVLNAAADWMKRGPQSQQTPWYSRGAIVEAGAQSTVTPGDLNADGRTDAMGVLNAVVSWVNDIFVRAAFSRIINEQILKL